MRLERLLLTLILSFTAAIGFSQEKIVWKNGKELICNIDSLGSNSIYYTLDGAQNQQQVVSTTGVEYVQYKTIDNKYSKLKPVIKESEKIVWKNGDELICNIDSLGSDLIYYSLAGTQNQQQAVSIEGVEYVQFKNIYNEYSKLKPANSDSGSDVDKYAYKEPDYEFPKLKTIRSKTPKDISLGLGVYPSATGRLTIASFLKGNIDVIHSKKASLGLSASLFSYDPTEKKYIVTLAGSASYRPIPRKPLSMRVEGGYGYTSANFNNALESDFFLNMLEASGGLYGGLWFYYDWFSVEKSNVQVFTGFNYQDAKFKFEFSQNAFIVKDQDLTFLRFWIGTSLRF